MSDLPAELDTPETIDRLTNRLEALERRVEVLEHPLAAQSLHASPKPVAASQPNASVRAQAGGIFGVLGRAMLGIGGAYVLRAVEESSSLPRMVVASAGIAYAFIFLAWAARGRAQKLSSTIYACTSALILAPMLWELTLRFRVLPATMAAGVLGAFALAAYFLSWKYTVAPVLRVGLVSVAVLSLALAVASHAALPFITVLLILAALFEFIPGHDQMLEIRVPVALAADAAIWILIYVYFAPQSARADYPQLSRDALISPALTMFLIFAAGVSLQTVVRRKKVTAFQTVQTTISLLLAAVSLADFGPPGITMILGIVCLVLSAATYTSAFTVFAAASERRNRVVFLAWGAALLLAGSFLCLPPLPLTVLLGAAAIAVTAVGARTGWLDFEFEGAALLLTAAAESGLFAFLFGALAGVPSSSPPLATTLIAGCAVLCYAAAKPLAGEPWKSQLLHLAVAALAAGASAAQLVHGLVALTALNVIPCAHHVAFIRTLVLCSAALALVFGGARWRRRELTRIGYAALVLVAVKLVAEDLRHGHLAYIAASIFLFALTLIAAPRVAKAQQES